MTEVLRVLAEARARGFLGPGLPEEHVQHASVLVQGLAASLGDGGAALDLGSGAGVPGLLLAEALPGSRWTLVDAHRRRAVFAREAARQLHLGDRVEVVVGRAEAVGREPDRRGAYDVVVARGFGPPGVTAECGAPFLRVGGLLAVSEPPEEQPERWPTDGLAELGLVAAGEVAGTVGRWRLLRAVTPCPPRYPRRTGVPRRRPLF